MSSGLFILLYDDGSLENCLRNGVYGFLMPPVCEEKPSSQSRHYAVLSDYACCEEGTEIFFFNCERNLMLGANLITIMAIYNDSIPDRYRLPTPIFD